MNEKIAAVMEHIRAIEDWLYFEEIILAFYGELGQQALQIWQEERETSHDTSSKPSTTGARVRNVE